MKYRMLTPEEMEIFDEDFKHFAVANGVSNEEWLEMNTSNKELATQLVGLFSDTVLQKVYEKLKFIEHRSPSSCLVFKLNDSEIDLISLNAKSDKVDLSSAESIHDALVNNASELSIFRSNKKYSKVREEEIHEMLSQGCVNSSEAFWMMLEKVVD
ncbi:MAG: DUF6495 family protein [Crocinitomicaceae bacterium]|nr:DUF6495 family protein [Crocinitomicaceae bacterium]